MTSFKTLITALLVFAAATQPVAAAMSPCCCVEKVVAKTEPACCATKIAQAEEAAKAEQPACCAKRQPEQVAAKQHSTSSFEQAGCCCVKPAPAVPSERVNVVQRTIEAVAIDLAVDVQRPFVPEPAAIRFEYFAGSHSLSGPPLLALLCVWRK